MRALPFLAVALAAVCAAPATAQTTNDDAARRAAEQQEQQRRLRQQAETLTRQRFDPARLATVGLWPGPGVPCKLPIRDRPYVCHRLLVGPMVIVSELPLLEAIVARGDAALARGERSWWSRSRYLPIPLALAPGEVLYSVGDGPFGDSDLIATVYR